MLDDRDHALQAPQALSEDTAQDATTNQTASEPAASAIEPVPAATGPAVPPEPQPEPPPPVTQAPEVPEPPKGFRLGMSLFVLALVGASLVLGVQSVVQVHKNPNFYNSNNLGAQNRLILLITLAAGAAVPLLVGGVYAFLRRPAATDRLVRLARLSCPLLLAGFVPALFSWQLGQRAMLQYLFLLVLVVFASQYLLRQSLPEWRTVTAPRFLQRPWGALLRFGARQSAWLPLTIVLLGASGYAFYTSYYSIQQHRLIQTFAFDLGIYDNLMYTALSGKPFRSPVLFGPGDFSYLAGHAEYGMFLFLPFYALRPHAETLLVLQSVMMGFTAVPLFLFARTRLSQPLAVFLGLAYLLYAPLHGPNFYDFHWLPLAMFFHFWLYFALATRRNWLAIPCVLILFAMREDIAVGLCVLGLFLCLTGERVRFGLTLAVASVTWFVLNKFVLMRLAGTWWFENLYAELFADGKVGYGSVIKTLLSNPVFGLATLAHEPKLTYTFHLLTPLAFLPARKLALVPLLLPGFFFTLLTTGYWPTTSIAFQYTTHWIPYLFLGTVLALWLMSREPDGKLKVQAAVLTVALALTSHSYNFGAILQRESFMGGFLQVTFNPTPAQHKRYEALMTLVRKIPREASVVATEFLNPHVSAREEVYTFRYEVPPVDYILVSKPEVTGETTRLLTLLMKKASYGLVGEAGNEFYLFKKGAPLGEKTDAALKRLHVKLKEPEKKPNEKKGK